MGDTLPATSRTREEAAVALANDAFTWFSDAARRNRIGYQTSWILTLVLGAAVTVVAALEGPPAITSVLGAGVLITQGLQRGFHWSDNYYHFRAAAEEMRRTNAAFETYVAPFDADDRHTKLATVTLNVLRTEQRAWQALYVNADQPKKET